MMKKFVTMFLALLLVSVTMYACGDGSHGNTETTSPDPIVTEPAEQPVVIESYDQFTEAEHNTLVSVESYIQGKHIWSGSKCDIYIQNEQGEAYLLYQAVCTKEQYDQLEIGTKIRAVGYKASAWEDIIEIVDAKIEILDGNYVAEPADVTSLIGNEEGLKDYRNQKVLFKDVKVEEVEKGLGVNGEEINLTVSKGSSKITLLVKPSLVAADSENYTNINELSKGAKVDVTCFIERNNVVYPYVASANEHVTITPLVRHKTPLVDGKTDLYVAVKDDVYYIDDLDMTEAQYSAIQVGTKLRINGFKNHSDGLVKLLNVDYTVMTAGASDKLDSPKSANVLVGLESNNSAFKLHKGKYRLYSDLAVSEIVSGQGESGQDIYLKLMNDSGYMDAYVEADVVGVDSELYKQVSAFKVGDYLDLEGFLIREGCSVPSVVNAYKSTFIQEKYSWADGKGLVYTQNRSGVSALYLLECTEKEFGAFKIGTRIVAVDVDETADAAGTVSAKYLAPGNTKDQYVAEAVVCDGLLGDAALKESIHKLVTFTNMTVSSIEALGSDYRMTLTKDGETIDAIVETALVGSTSDAYLVTAGLTEGTSVDITGFLKWTDNGACVTATEVIERIIIDTYVQAKYSNVDGLAVMYVQDENGVAYRISDSVIEDYYDLEVGDKIRVEGFITVNGDIIEITGATATMLEGEFVADIVDVTSLIGTADLALEHDKLVAMNGLTVTNVKVSKGIETATLTVSNGNFEFNVVVEGVYVGSDSDTYTTACGIIIGETVDIEGFLHYNGTRPEPAVRTLVKH